jgi:hypothetical protein
LQVYPRLTDYAGLNDARATYYTASQDRLILRRFTEFVSPGMDDRVAIEVIDCGQDSILELMRATSTPWGLNSLISQPSRSGEQRVCVM